MIHCVLHDPNDSVAVVVVEGVKAGMTLTGLILDEDRTLNLPCVQDIPLGHKVALKDMAILKQRSEGGSETDRAAMVDELAEFLAGHEGEGVFVVGSRLSADRLKKDYGIPASK